MNVVIFDCVIYFLPDRGIIVTLCSELKNHIIELILQVYLPEDLQRVRKLAKFHELLNSWKQHQNSGVSEAVHYVFFQKTLSKIQKDLLI